LGTNPADNASGVFAAIGATGSTTGGGFNIFEIGSNKLYIDNSLMTNIQVV
jgi:hypothetical protein